MTNDELDKIYHDHEDYIAKVFRIQLRKQHDAGIYISKDDEEEVYSWICQKVVRYLPRYNPKKSALPSYIYTIVASQFRWCLIRMRGMDGRHPSEAWNRSFAHYDDPDANIALEEPETPRTVDDVLDELPDDLRTMCELIMSGMKRADVARQMGWSRNTLRANLARLKRILKGDDDAPTQ